MKRFFLRFSTLALLFSLLLALFSACGGSPTDKPEDEAGGTADELDFGGETFSMYQGIKTDTSVLGYTMSTVLADMTLDRIKATEAELNCKLNIEYDQNIYSFVNNSSATGSCDADIIYTASGDYIARLAMAELLHSFEESEVIDITDYEKYGNLELLESCMVDGIIYGLIPLKWPDKPFGGNIGSLIAFNGKIIADNNMADLREINENKLWTTDNFTAIIPEYAMMTEGDDAVYALAYHKCNFVRGFLGANGMKMVAEEDGKLVEPFTTKEVLNILGWANEFVKVNKPYIKSLPDYTADIELLNGNCTMAVTETANVGVISYGLEDFGILPFPCGPDIEYGTQSTFFSVIPAFAVTINGLEPDYCDYILDRLLEPFEGYETEESIVELLDQTMFFDPRDAEYYASLYKHTQYQYFATQGYAFMETIAEQFGKKNPSELIQSIKGTLQSQIDTYMAPNYEYIKAHKQAEN